jgi:hypothetical protein
MNLDELKLRLSALLAARYSGTRSVSYDGKTVDYGTDAELACRGHAAVLTGVSTWLYWKWAG